MPEMNLAEPALKRLRVEEFLAWDDGTDRRYELVAGESVAMAPVQGVHSALAASFATARRSGSQWIVVDLKAGDTVALQSVYIAFPIDDLYQGIEFPAAS